jgi:hypothetical protein
VRTQLVDILSPDLLQDVRFLRVYCPKHVAAMCEPYLDEDGALRVASKIPAEIVETKT